jgi:granule-bound starch synthase
LLQVCIVSSTGGLVDTVKEGYTGFHMGAFNVEVKVQWQLLCLIYSFPLSLILKQDILQCDVVDQADVAAIVKTAGRALAVYGTTAFKEMIKNCMSQDLSWKVSD